MHRATRPPPSRLVECSSISILFQSQQSRWPETSQALRALPEQKIPLDLTKDRIEKKHCSFASSPARRFQLQDLLSALVTEGTVSPDTGSAGSPGGMAASLSVVFWGNSRGPGVSAQLESHEHPGQACGGNEPWRS